MKTIKFIDERNLNIYRQRQGAGKIFGGSLDGLFDPDHCIKAGWENETGSASGTHVATAIYFTEDVLNLPDNYQYKGIDFGSSSGDYLLVPFEFEGHMYEGFINIRKFNLRSQTEQEQLERECPKYFSYKPDKKLGFFDEDLHEDIDRDYSSDSEIATIMDNPNLSMEEKAKRLFDRDPDHIYLFGLASFYIDGRLYDIARQNGVTNFDTSELKHSIAIWKRNNTYSIGCTTVMCIGNQTEPLNVQESYDYYVNHTNTTRFHGDGASYPAIQWGKYLKHCIEATEEAVGYKHVKEKRLGFFDEDMNMTLDLVQESIDKNLNVEEINSIMGDTSLSGEQKSQKLFGRPEDYICHLQYLVMSADDGCGDYLLEHGYISEAAIQEYGKSRTWDKLGHTADSCTPGFESGRLLEVCTVFYTDRTCLNLDGSWDYYAAGKSDRYKFAWGDYIKQCIDKIEESGLVQWKRPKQLGFFSD